MRNASLFLLLLAACDDASAPAGGGGHGHKAPNGGQLVELGEHFAQLEFVAGGGRLTLYVLDGHASGALRIEQREVAVDVGSPGGAPKRLLLAATANALTGEKPGDSSQFDAPFENAAAFEGVVEAIQIKGQSFKAVKFRYPGGGR